VQDVQDQVRASWPDQYHLAMAAQHHPPQGPTLGGAGHIAPQSVGLPRAKTILPGHE